MGRFQDLFLQPEELVIEQTYSVEEVHEKTHTTNVQQPVINLEAPKTNLKTVSTTFKNTKK